MDLDFLTWSEVLVYLQAHVEEAPTVQTICNNLTKSSSAVIQTIRLLKKKDLIKYDKKGRINKYVLTTKGKTIAGYLEKIFSLTK
jgi:predicted transcriptional regulator